MPHESHLRWYRIVAETDLGDLPFASFYREAADRPKES